MECLICKEDGDLVNLKCQNKYDHYLCESCIDQWENSNRSYCPACLAQSDKIFNGRLFHTMNKEDITLKIANKALNCDLRNIKYIPENIITEEMCLRLIGNPSHYCLGFIPEYARSYKMCIVFLNDAGDNIAYVPHDIMDKKHIYDQQIDYSNRMIEYYEKLGEITIKHANIINKYLEEFMTEYFTQEDKKPDEFYIL